MTATTNGSDLRSLAYDVAALVRGQGDIVDRLDTLIAAVDALGVVLTGLHDEIEDALIGAPAARQRREAQR